MNKKLKVPGYAQNKLPKAQGRPKVKKMMKKGKRGM